MTTPTNVQQDVRRRTDEYEREYVATAGGNGMAVRDAATEVNVSDHLLHLLEKSAQSLRHTAENVENRGLKLLLKVVAQARVAMYNELRQASGQGVADPLDPANKSSATRLQQGLQDIQTSMTVQRQGRENVALNHLREEEAALLAAYQAVSARDNTSSLQTILNEQESAVAAFYRRLEAVGDGLEPIVARVFDTRVEAESATARLQAQGLALAQMDAVPITQVTRPVLKSSIKPASPRNTMVAGAFGGAIVGGLVGGALAAYISSSPQFVGWVTFGPGTLLVAAILIFAFFGTVFGFFIGQNRREDDIAVTVDGLINGEVLVVAYPQPHQIELAENALQLHHARELNR